MVGNSKQSPFRQWLPLLVLLWVAAEIYCMVLVARATSGLLVVALLVAGALAGSALLRRAGLAALRNAMRSAQPGAADADAEPTGRAPRTGNAVAAGIFLMIPGFLTDVLGLACLFPPTGRLLRRLPERLLRRNPVYQQVRMHRPDGKVVEGEVVDPPTQPYDYGAKQDDRRRLDR